MTAQLPIATEVTPMVLKFDPVISMTDEQLFDFCQLNKDFRIERKANGEIAIALVRCFVPQHDKLVLCHSVACFSEGVRSEVVEIRDASFLSMTSYVILNEVKNPNLPQKSRCFVPQHDKLCHSEQSEESQFAAEIEMLRSSA